jgi:hypothetical protein
VELPWFIKIRIIGVIAAGLLLIGIWAWPIASPLEPAGPVSFLFGNITLGGTIALLVLAFFSGFVAYFLSWPYGRQIGVLAVPSGLAVWAVRTGSVGSIIQQYPSADYRQSLFSALKWEPIFWLAVVFAGFAGVWVAGKISSGKIDADKQNEASPSKSTIYVNALIALAGSVLLAQLCLKLFAQDVRMLDSRLGVIVAQPVVGQIVFAVLFSFGLAAFLVEKFLNAGYLWSVIATGLVAAFIGVGSTRPEVLQYLSQNVPANFFPNAILAIMPVQMVAFGTLGSIAGYWTAIRYDYWRENES